MRLGAFAAAAALMASAALADIAPPPDRGPPSGHAGGLSFMIQSIEYEMGPANGPHYTKTRPAAVLTGCVDAMPNCALAKKSNLIGLEVSAVDGVGLAPEKGMVRQILDAFADPKAPPTIALTLVAAAADSQPIVVKFARR